MALHVSGKKSSRRGKAMAILAGGAIIGLGTTATLASWTDTEWVFGGTTNNGQYVPGLGTSQFNVQQNVTSPYVADVTSTVGGVTTVASTSFNDRDSNPGGGLTFTAPAIALSPGTTTYAPVALRTDSTSVAGKLTLQKAQAGNIAGASDAGNVLWNALTQRVWVSETPFLCGKAAVDAALLNPTGGVTLVNAGALASPTASSTQDIAAKSGSTQFYCFEISLPAVPMLTNDTQGAATPTLKDLQGRTVVPAWLFAAASA